MDKPATPVPMSFARWMELALFHPERGYYSRRITGIGRSGDFSTSASLDGTLGTAIAAWITARLGAMPDVHTVIEVGAGDGSLAKTVLANLSWWTRRKLKLFIVERSPSLRDKQRETVGADKATWFDRIEDALSACEGYALIFHNELLDAFPVTLVQWSVTGGGWDEVLVEATKGGVKECLSPLKWYPSELDCYSVLSEWSKLKPPPHPEQRCEVAKSVFTWLQNWSLLWKCGAMLTIDYGDTFPQLYHRRATGTLRAYFMHQRLTGPEVYQNMGHQDVTADVNFTDLMRWGKLLNWNNKPLQTQREFIQSFAPKLFNKAASDPSVAFLTDEEGAGSAFKVLEQSREPGAETRRRRTLASIAGTSGV